MFNGTHGFQKQLEILLNKLSRDIKDKSSIASIGILCSSAYADGILTADVYYHALIMLAAYIKEEREIELSQIRNVLENLTTDDQ